MLSSYFPSSWLQFVAVHVEAARAVQLMMSFGEEAQGTDRPFEGNIYSETRQHSLDTQTATHH